MPAVTKKLLEVALNPLDFWMENGDILASRCVPPDGLSIRVALQQPIGRQLKGCALTHLCMSEISQWKG